MKPIYKSGHIKVYPDRLEFRDGLKKRMVPINQIAGVYTTMYGNIKIVTTGRKKFKIQMSIHSKDNLRKAILKAQSNGTNVSSKPESVADELTKLKELQEKGVINEQEFEKQKNELLNS